MFVEILDYKEERRGESFESIQVIYISNFFYRFRYRNSE